MNLESMDLNLLPILHALAKERHVTRAGQRIGLSQPATSNALTRLRAMLDDPILVRTGNTMQLTPVAEELMERLEPALNALSAALTVPEQFDPRAAHGLVRIGTTDHVAMLLAPPLHHVLRDRAPGVALEFRALGEVDAPSLLRQGHLDLVIGVYRRLNPLLRRAPLFTEDIVCLMRKGHPALEGIAPGVELPMDRYLASGHLRVSTAPDDPGPIATSLQRLGLERNVTCTVPAYSPAPFIVAESDLICTISTRAAEHFASVLGVEFRPAPVEIQPQEFDIIWHSRSEDNDLAAWVRSAIIDIVACREADVSLVEGDA